MSIVSLIAILVVIGAALYLVNSVLPIDPKIKTIINVVVVVLTLLWLLDAFVDPGVLRVPRHHATTWQSVTRETGLS